VTASPVWFDWPYGSGKNGRVRFRLFSLSLALLVLVQPGIVCACTVEHVLLCGDEPASHHDDTGLLSQVTPCRVALCGATCGECRGHQARAGCVGRESLRAGHGFDVRLGAPALPAFAPDGLFDSRSVACLDFGAIPPQPPPGADRQVPQLN
jgi:hypothetical protein